MEEVNSTMIYCKNFVNVTMYPQYNNNMIIKINFKKKIPYPDLRKFLLHA
jgi:hypothetical protein